MKNKHREAMRLFHDALVVKENGQKFIELTAKALELEKEVLMNLSQSDDRLTKSVIQLSIASLAYNLRDFKQVNDIISKAIFKDIPYQIFSDMLGLQLNRSQQEFAKAENPYTRALAPAGSGKTTTLLWRCLNDALVTGQKNKYLIFTFTRAARDELRDRVNTLNEFEPIRKLTRIETLNQWGNTYLKGIKDGLQLKTSKQDYYFLINNSLRPLWEDTPILQRIKKLNVYYNKIIEIFGEIKTLGFRHTFNDESVFFEKFEEHLKWLEVNNLTNYFIEKVYKPLIEFELIDQTTTDLLGILSPFLKFWKDSSNS